MCCMFISFTHHHKLNKHASEDYRHFSVKTQSRFSLHKETLRSQKKKKSRFSLHKVKADRNALSRIARTKQYHIKKVKIVVPLFDCLLVTL